MIQAIIAVSFVCIFVGAFLWAREKGERQEREPEDKPAGSEPEPEEIFADIEWWPEVWGPRHPQIPDLVIVDDDAAGTVALYDWKTEENRRAPGLVGPGRGTEWQASG